MKLKTLASHTVNLDRLPDPPVVLDVGCRWFDFTHAVLAERPKASIYALDPARDVVMETTLGNNVHFLRRALVGAGQPTEQRFAHYSTGEGDFLTTLPKFHDAEFYQVETVNISQLMTQFHIEHFDLVKLDCESSEFGILETWPGPIATQISVEFHDWDKPRYRATNYFDELWRKLPWYKVVQHELSRQGDGVGHWDTLLELPG
jgi:FkbM family methyltransferase